MDYLSRKSTDIELLKDDNVKPTVKNVYRYRLTSGES